MELTEVKRSKTRRNGILILRVSPGEALRLISSLSEQIRTGDCNGPRHEQFLDDGRDFSIAVHGGQHHA